MDNQRLMIEKQIELLMAQSTDMYYTEYLTKLLHRLRTQEVTTEYAISEVNRTYQMYLERNRVAVPTQPTIQPQQNQQFMPVMSQAVVQATPERPKKNMEFAIGAGLLSVIGILFVLIAFVMLGITYMNGMIKGLCLYAIAVAVVVASELILSKKMPRFAVGITGLGICGLYLATMLNYLYLKNFNGIVALIIAVGISLIAILISRKKDSGIIKIISFIGCYICIFPVGEPFMGIEAWDGNAIIPLLITTAILLIVNLMTLLLPVKKNGTLVHIVHMIANTIFSFAFMIAVFDRTYYAEDASFILYFLVLSVLVQGLIFYVLDRRYLNNISEVRGSAEYAGQIIYVVTNIFLLGMIILIGCFVVLEKAYHVHLTVGSVVLICVLLFVLFRKHPKKWMQYWFGSFFVLSLYCVGSFPIMIDNIFGGNHDSWSWWRFGSTLAVFFAAKLLAGVKKLRVSELLITLYTALLAIWTFAQLNLDWTGKVVDQGMLFYTFVASIVFLSAFLLSLMALKYWKSVYEEIVIVVFMAFILLNFWNDFTPALLMGILFVGMIGFNSVDFTRGKYLKVFNYINLGLIVCLYIWIAFLKNPLLYIVMLLLGISYIILTFRDKYEMDFKVKNLILVLFLCYMTLVWEMPLPIIKSIVVAVIAIGSVAVGFAIRDKSLRITGLVLTLIVCAKIVVYDFAELADVEKMILFLVTGLIALAISGIYIALEKKIV